MIKCWQMSIRYVFLGSVYHDCWGLTYKLLCRNKQEVIIWKMPLYTNWTSNSQFMYLLRVSHARAHNIWLSSWGSCRPSPRDGYLVPSQCFLTPELELWWDITSNFKLTWSCCPRVPVLVKHWGISSQN